MRMKCQCNSLCGAVLIYFNLRIRLLLTPLMIRTCRDCRLFYYANKPNYFNIHYAHLLSNHSGTKIFFMSLSFAYFYL